jgi:ribose transport system substrate-binding protein
MKRLVFLSVTLIAVVLAACSNGANKAASDGSSGAAKPTDVKNQLYIHVELAGNLDYMYDHKLGTAQAGKDLGVKTSYVGPAEYDVGAMIAAFEQAIAQKPKGIVVMGVDDSLKVEIKKAIDAGIPVITVDADLPDSGRLAFVGTGNLAAGKLGGEEIARLIDGKGKVAIMTKPGQPNLDERVEGYKQALSKYPDIKIVQIANTNADTVVAAQAAAAILQKYPDLAGIACVESAGGSGAATAVSEAKKQGKVKIVSMDRSNDVIQAIEDGVITASIAQQTALMSYYAIQILYNYTNSHDIGITTDNKSAGITGTPVSVDTGCVIVDKSNAKYFMRKK